MLGLGDPNPTTMSLLIVNNSIKNPMGVFSLVNVDILIFLADFVTLD